MGNPTAFEKRNPHVTENYIRDLMGTIHQLKALKDLVQEAYRKVENVIDQPYVYDHLTNVEEYLGTAAATIEAVRQLVRSDGFELSSELGFRAYMRAITERKAQDAEKLARQIRPDDPKAYNEIMALLGQQQADKALILANETVARLAAKAEAVPAE